MLPGVLHSGASSKMAIINQPPTGLTTDVELSLTNPERIFYRSPYVFDEPQIIERGHPYWVGEVTFGIHDVSQLSSAGAIEAFMADIASAGNTALIEHFRAVSKGPFSLGRVSNGRGSYSSIMDEPDPELAVGQMVQGPYTGGSGKRRLFIVTNVTGGSVELAPKNFMNGQYQPAPTIHCVLTPVTTNLVETLSSPDWSGPWTFRFSEVPLEAVVE